MKKTKWNGGDFSHWNNEKDFIKYVEQCEFFAHKATESTSFIDNCFYDRILRYMDTKPAIAYHVLTNTSDVIKQADFFINMVLNAIYHSDKGRIGYMIDIEYQYFKTEKEDDILKKIIEFGDCIVKKVNHRPIVYLGDMYSENLYRTLKNYDWLIWIARYTHEKNIVHSEYMDFWQFTNNPYDKDYFYGTEEKLWSFLRGWK